MDRNRKTAYKALLEIETNGAYSNLAAASAIEAVHPDNEPFVRKLIYGVLENQIYIDHRLNQLVRSGLGKVRRQAVILLRLGAYQIEFLNSVPDYAAINECVKMARKYCRGLEGFVNGVLRAYARGEGMNMPDPEKDLSSFLSVRYSFSKDIVEKWLQEFGPERTRSLLEAGNAVPELTVRVNTLKCSAEQLTERLKADGISLRPVLVPGIPGERLKDISRCAEGSGLLHADAFRDGWFYVQDAASSAAVAALDPAPGQTLIDLCAAPGGKSFSAAMMMEDKGRIISCDIYDHKMELIRSSAARLGIGILKPELWDATEYNAAFAELADRVIADVPCSGLGVVRRRPEIKLKAEYSKIEELAVLQKRILNNAALYVKAGGRLMYSTCTISAEENGQVTGKFLEEHPEFCVLEEKQLLPDSDHCDGFYYCVMQKA